MTNDVSCGGASVAVLAHWRQRWCRTAPAPANAQIVRVSSSTDSAPGDRLQPRATSWSRAKIRGLTTTCIFNNLDSLLFEIDDFNGVTFGAEWLFALDRLHRARRRRSATTRARHRASTRSRERRRRRDRAGTEAAPDPDVGDGSIPADRPRRAAVQPYIGAGVGAINWRYTETGEFVDFERRDLPRELRSHGTEVGPVVLGGVRFPVADMWNVGGEIRWHRGQGRYRRDRRGLPRRQDRPWRHDASTSPCTSASSASEVRSFQGPVCGRSRHLEP